MNNEVILTINWRRFDEVKMFFKYLAKEKYTWEDKSRIRYGDNAISDLIREYHEYNTISINLKTKTILLNNVPVYTYIKSTVEWLVEMFQNEKFVESIHDRLDDLDRLIKEKEG